MADATDSAASAPLDTLIPTDGQVASGGTDLFLAGARRTIEDGAFYFYGVRSRCCEDGSDGADVPRDDPFHDPFPTYTLTMLGDTGPDFYRFTLDAAPSGYAAGAGCAGASAPVRTDFERFRSSHANTK